MSKKMFFILTGILFLSVFSFIIFSTSSPIIKCIVFISAILIYKLLDFIAFLYMYAEAINNCE
jgi:hypothetical protein